MVTNELSVKAENVETNNITIKNPENTARIKTETKTKKVPVEIKAETVSPDTVKKIIAEDDKNKIELKDTILKIQKIYSAIAKEEKTSNLKKWELAENLCKIKNKISNFSKFIKANFKFTPNYAYELMEAYRIRKGIEAIADGTFDIPEAFTCYKGFKNLTMEEIKAIYQEIKKTGAELKQSNVKKFKNLLYPKKTVIPDSQTLDNKFIKFVDDFNSKFDSQKAIMFIDAFLASGIFSKNDFELLIKNIEFLKNKMK